MKPIENCFRHLRVACAPLLLALFITPVCASLHAWAVTQQTKRATARITWNGQPGVSRYRLQLARDIDFSDIVFDRAVTGREYTVTELDPGNYFWRVAPAVRETGTFSKATPVEVTDRVVAESNPSAAIDASDNAGWNTATGEMIYLSSAPLRSRSSLDVLGLNSKGTVYALEGASGIAMWTARFQPHARANQSTLSKTNGFFAPLVVPTAQGTANVIVGFENGVRALQGATGRELWRATMLGRAVSGSVADAQTGSAGGAAQVVIAADSPAALYVLDAATGRVLSRNGLPGTVIGQPAVVPRDNTFNIVLALEGKTIEARRANGSRLETINLDAQITTAPLVVSGGSTSLVMIGTERGLIAINGRNLEPLWRVATDEDQPRGELAAVDLDADNSPEVVMITRRGRLVVINTTDGKIRWHANGAIDAGRAVFAHLNSDNVPDILVAAGKIFAHGYSGRDGSLIWRANENDKTVEQNSLRPLSIASQGSAAYLVGGDVARIGLRAIGLPSIGRKSALQR